MRIDPNFKIFGGHPEWYTIKKGVGYIPTDKAPEAAAEAMRKYNSYKFNKK